MTATTVDVFLDDIGEPVPVGTAYVDMRSATTTTTFEYRPDYFARPHSWRVSADLREAVSHRDQIARANGISDLERHRFEPVLTHHVAAGA